MIVCIILFLILSLFDVILLFPRMLSSVKFINRFKPLFDAYFGSYKDAYSFWTGLQLLTRAIFFALSAVGTDFSFIGGIALVGGLLCIQGIMHPFKSRYNNIQESLILLNLVTLYVVLKNSDDGIEKIIAFMKFLINIILAAFFISVIAHCIMLKCGNRIKHKYCNMLKQLLSIIIQVK